MFHSITSPTIRGRLAPSPTGRLHLGNAFAFLLAFCSVRFKGGSLVLRMEDIDPDRSRPEFERGILEDLAWLGIEVDEGPDQGGAYGPYRQSDRLDGYASALKTLEGRGVVYPCFCTRKELKMMASAPHNDDGGTVYPGTCRRLDEAEREKMRRSGRKACLRLDVEKATATGYEGPVARGGDFALMRSDGVFAYQLAVVVDDGAMRITEVVRGDDLEASTPRQLLLYHLLGLAPPSFFHFPLLCDHEEERLAKRHGGMALAALRGGGVPPEAVTGYLGFLSGLLDAPKAMTPLELARYWDPSRIRRKKILLPADVTDVLAAMA